MEKIEGLWNKREIPKGQNIFAWKGKLNMYQLKLIWHFLWEKYDLRLIYTKKSKPKIINSKIDKKQQHEMARKFFAIFSNKRHMFSETEKNAWTEKRLQSDNNFFVMSYAFLRNKAHTTHLGQNNLSINLKLAI